jgi:1-acyl-sn-glycerol-3-phosphate acyltransferase
MIHADHKAWAHALFSRYTRNFCQRRFHAIEVLGQVPAPPPDHALLLLPNHSTWWDGFFVYLLNERLFQRRFHVMMLEEKLREFWFFRHVGAYSIAPNSPKAIAETLTYTASLLDSAPRSPSASQPARASRAPLAPLAPIAPLVTMFPQGELRPSRQRPLGYNRGVEWLLKKCQKPVAVLPLAMRCEFLREEKPEVFLLFGDMHIALPVSPNSLVSPNAGAAHTPQYCTAQALEAQTEALLGSLESRISAGERGLSLL